MEARKKSVPFASSLFLWEREYLYQGIPSSFRSGPSGFLKDFLRYLKERMSLEGMHALDLGCGRGRNTFFLSRQKIHVTCIDFIQSNIDYIQSVATIKGCPVTPLCSDIRTPLPLETDSIDFALDIFCYKHQTSWNVRKQYQKELVRVLKPGGYLFVSLAAHDDGFYGPLLQTSPYPSSNIVIDPFSNISSVLFSESEMREEFRDTFEVRELWQKRKEGIMHGGCYQRSSLGAVLQVPFS